MKDLKQITTHLTPAQLEAFKQAQAIAEIENQSNLLRQLIAEFCERQGVEFPADLPKWGQRRDYLERGE